MTRRTFFQTLAAAFVAAKVPLPAPTSAPALDVLDTTRVYFFQPGFIGGINRATFPWWQNQINLDTPRLFVASEDTFKLYADLEAEFHRHAVISSIAD